MQFTTLPTSAIWLHLRHGSTPLRETGCARGSTWGSTKTMNSPARRHLDALDGMRAVAVGIVLGHHAAVPRMAGGYSGVDIFFVLSGFLITGLLFGERQRTGRVNLKAF